MVFFVCETCNESLRKNKVEAHSLWCKRCWILTCVDCNQQFTFYTYTAHTTCMTEAQKYEGKFHEARDSKGMQKQSAWLQRVRECSADPSVARELRPYVERLLQHDNIPRKRAKFENFAKNSLRLHNAQVLSGLWSVFERAAQPVPATPAPPTKPTDQTSPRCTSDSREVLATGASARVDANSEMVKGKLPAESAPARESDGGAAPDNKTGTGRRTNRGTTKGELTQRHPADRDVHEGKRKRERTPNDKATGAQDRKEKVAKKDKRTAKKKKSAKKKAKLGK